MEMDLKRLTPLLALLSLIPIVTNIVAVFFLLPETVPLHIGFDGIDRVGSKYETFVIGGLLTGFNLLFTLSFWHAEKLEKLGLVHGTNAKGARICLLGVIILF
ncbi:MAG: DUF1648 domain-containing protein, partial [Coriobacteriales bacterium]|nr:DUF1648 domain-containing protein [Coriobacteriales bacterium]